MRARKLLLPATMPAAAPAQRKRGERRKQYA
jgi:hypothetical protein